MAPWRSLGLVVADRRVPLFGAGVEIDESADPGLRRLVVSGIDAAITAIDGVPVEVRGPSPPTFAVHELGATHVDHVVIATDSVARTCGAVADITGAPLKRVREAGDVRQGFHRVGGAGALVVEVVERTGLPEGSTTLWGFVLVVDDLHATCARLGPLLVSAPRDAVQAGRRIATFTAAAGLGVPVALMSPDHR